MNSYKKKKKKEKKRKKKRINTQLIKRNGLFLIYTEINLRH